MAIRKAVIPAAGLGTRFLPATKAQPKEMLPLIDKPIIQYVVEEAVKAGIEDILIVTGRGKRAIEDHFDHAVELEYHLRRNSREDLLGWMRDISMMADIHFVRQKETLGLGHAVLQARRHVGDEPFCLLLGDEVFLSEVPCLAQLIRQYDRVETGCVLAVQPVPIHEVSRYGVIEGRPIDNGLYSVSKLVEKPQPGTAPSNLAIVGRYILDPAIFKILEALPPGFNNEIQLTDALDLLRSTMPVYAYEPECLRLDVGDKLGYLKATVELALRRSDTEQVFRSFLQERIDRNPNP